ncbi:MAG: histidine phosphatase family protein [Candidatus Heimdallarchaeota archaeon]|nr:histidine phosphatase family protein [Candidatus Heimdallarchaeota archaeon]
MYVHFIRHGQSEANLSKTIIQGQLNSSLSEKGRQQAADLSEKLTFNFDLVYSSPLERAKQTAIISLQGLDWDVSKIKYDDDLREIWMGNWEGLTFEEIGISREELRPIVWLDHDVLLDHHEGESVVDFKKRTVNAFNKIVENAQSNGINSILIYSHGGVMRSVLKHHLKIYDGPYYNTQIVTIKRLNEIWGLVESNP